jgi:hypothetical protein
MKPVMDFAPYTAPELTEKNFPRAFKAMDAAAAEWAEYPDEKWQLAFLSRWAKHQHDEILKLAIYAIYD